MRRPLALAALLLALPAAAQSVGVAWQTDLTEAFAAAKEQQKILMVCVNAKQVDGETREEPAGKGLREVVYKDSRFVNRSREFVCALLTPESKDGELRLLGIEGRLVSPQHIFVDPDGTRILLRKEYWSHGRGEAAVTALLEMMDEAKAKLAAPAEAPVPAEGAPAAPPPGSDERAAWIAERIREIVTGQKRQRAATIDLLLRNDSEGDTKRYLFALLEEHKKDLPLLADLLRGLGRDQLLDAAAPVAAFLTHKEEALRGMAAVSLEYIGSREKAVVAALIGAAGREPDDAIANHMYRALGRCGAGEAKARELLLKKCEQGKSEFASYGPAIGLAYFEKDKKAAAGVEKQLKKIGIPGGRRGGGENTVKRGVLGWTLACIGDPKSGPFVREELLAKLENVQAFWVDGLRRFYETVARACEGDAAALPAIEEGVRGIVAFTKGAEMERYGAETRHLIDDYRKDRPNGNFTPKGEFLLGNANP